MDMLCRLASVKKLATYGLINTCTIINQMLDIDTAPLDSCLGSGHGMSSVYTSLQNPRPWGESNMSLVVIPVVIPAVLLSRVALSLGWVLVCFPVGVVLGLLFYSFLDARSA